MQYLGAEKTRARRSPIAHPMAGRLGFGLRACASFRKNCVNSLSNDHRKRAPHEAPFSNSCNGESDQRFENWNDLRALARPYFLRSTTRESRVRKPPFFRTVRS